MGPKLKKENQTVKTSILSVRQKLAAWGAILKIPALQYFHMDHTGYLVICCPTFTCKCGSISHRLRFSFFSSKLLWTWIYFKRLYSHKPLYVTNRGYPADAFVSKHQICLESLDMPSFYKEFFLFMGRRLWGPMLSKRFIWTVRSILVFGRIRLRRVKYNEDCTVLFEM